MPQGIGVQVVSCSLLGISNYTVLFPLFRNKWMLLIKTKVNSEIIITINRSINNENYYTHRLISR